MLIGICSPNLSRAAAISAILDVYLGTSTVVDSYDSSDPTKSTNGQYDPVKAGSQGDITCNVGVVAVYGSSIVHGSISTNVHAPFPTASLPFNQGFTPAGGDIFIEVGMTTNLTLSVTNSLTPPPTPATNQTIISTTNVTFITTTNYPDGMTGVQTNKNTFVSGTNRIVYAVQTNYVCGTNTYSGNNLPTNVCSYTRLGNGAPTYHYTLIEETNILYQTNLVYIYGTNYTYTYKQYVYNYTIYTASPYYQTNYYDHVLCGDYYATNGLSGLTAVKCPSELVMPTGFQMSAGDQIVIMPGASLTIHSGGTNCILNADAITNQTGFPSSFVLYGLDDMTNVTVSGSSNFSGVIIAPQANVKINSGFASPLNFFGAAMVKSFAVTGGLNFHYDEALGQLLSPPRPSGAVKGADGAFGFNVPGDSGLTFVVQASTNLVDWIPVATNVGPFYFSDTNADSIEKRFYRVVWPW